MQKWIHADKRHSEAQSPNNEEQKMQSSTDNSHIQIMQKMIFHGELNVFRVRSRNSSMHS
jgi:hypothetical protein